mmetsp:Transcript_75408/g.245286  ORF Transcript_75408/g.245286 Transcript_75408/m.245286 type:complete len:252 (+) Transcript_75408:1588-2343(+)
MSTVGHDANQHVVQGLLEAQSCRISLVVSVQPRCKLIDEGRQGARRQLGNRCPHHLRDFRALRTIVEPQGQKAASDLGEALPAALLQAFAEVLHTTHCQTFDAQLLGIEAHLVVLALLQQLRLLFAHHAQLVLCLTGQGSARELLNLKTHIPEVASSPPMQAAGHRVLDRVLPCHLLGKSLVQKVRKLPARLRIRGLESHRGLEVGLSDDVRPLQSSDRQPKASCAQSPRNPAALGFRQGEWSSACRGRAP